MGKRGRGRSHYSRPGGQRYIHAIAKPGRGWEMVFFP
jgi:hypothetical protein